MTIETKISAKGRISYFSNGSQTRLGTIVDGLIAGETCEIINPGGERKIFAGYTSKTKKEIAAFIKAPITDAIAEIDPAEYAVTVEAQNVAINAERDNAFFAKPALERYKICRGVLGHTIDSRGRYMWHDISGRIIDKQRVAELLSLHGLTVDEYLACEKIAEAEFNAKMDAAFKARDAKKLIAEYAVTVDAQEIATDAEIELANDEQFKAQAPVVPLTGKITVDSGAKAFALVGEYFPNGIDKKKKVTIITIVEFVLA